MNHRFKLRIYEPLAVAMCICSCFAQRLPQLSSPTPIPQGATVVVGFLGGYDRWNDEHRSVRRLVLKLRHIPGVYAESISNHRRPVALAFILAALDTNGDQRLDAAERSQARVILFGQSWGGAAAIATARDLERRGIPVLLTVQVDSVGIHDATIPSNVHAAVNFYQHDPLTAIRGQREIKAADPSRTVILGNFEFFYFGRPVDRSNASLARRTIGGSHTKMELDPAVWSRVEQYITNAIVRRVP